MSKKSVSEELLDLYKQNDEKKIHSFNRKFHLSFLKEVRELLTLDYLKTDYKKEDVDELVTQIESKLKTILKENEVKDVDLKVKEFMDALPKIRELLIESAHAIFDGDPASNTIQEIVLTYPGFYAITNYRIAHLFYEMGLFFLARLISEDAHMRTGIDISPGAKIGRYFFIDHGTGIVIGETAVIGDNVKIYQGVTLGALSLRKGHSLKGNKRHPTIEDNVTIYSNAAIFGGDTVIGEGSVIGAVTYITKSIPKNSIISASKCGKTTNKK